MNRDRRFFVVRGKASHGSITHKCPTAAMALETLRRFEREAVQDVILHDPEGRSLTPEALEALVTGAAAPEATALAEPS
ncbi:MAG: hypothetical protein INR70_14395 [Parafilimonas terrae]|nr:hypothetical protein [Parafilimonas terrae]